MVEQDAHRRIDPRAGQGRPDRLHARGVRDASSSSTPTTTRSSAFRSSWRCAARAARACAGARSSPPSSAGSTTTRTSSSPSACATSTASPRLRLERQVRRRARRSATRCGTGPSSWRSTATRAIAEKGQLTVTYLTDAHRACARAARAAGCATAASTRWRSTRSATWSAVYHGSDAEAPSACSPAATTTPCATAASTTAGSASSCRWPACASCTRQGRRLPFGFEVVGFAEEEGQRYKATFLGSGALIGHFDPAWLDQKDADGITMREAMRTPACPRRWTPSPRCSATRRATSASSRCTSSRARCSTSSTCRWASSPRSTAACATCAR